MCSKRSFRGPHLLHQLGARHLLRCNRSVTTDQETHLLDGRKNNLKIEVEAVAVQMCFFVILHDELYVYS